MVTYNTNVQVDIKQPNFIEAGIHENIELKKIEYRISDKGNEFLVLTFEDENGATLIQTEWQPSKMDDEVKAQEKTSNQINRLRQIFCGYDRKNPETMTFIPHKDFDIQATTFKEFCEKAINILSDKFVGKKLRIKCGYYKDNFVILPNYSKFPFIEPMTIPTEKSKIRRLSMDKFERPEFKTSVPTANSLETTTKKGSTSEDEDLPF
jgi:hypothetical protein